MTTKVTRRSLKVVLWMILSFVQVAAGLFGLLELAKIYIAATEDGRSSTPLEYMLAYGLITLAIFIQPILKELAMEDGRC